MYVHCATKKFLWVFDCIKIFKNCQTTNVRALATKKIFPKKKTPLKFSIWMQINKFITHWGLNRMPSLFISHPRAHVIQFGVVHTHMICQFLLSFEYVTIFLSRVCTHWILWQGKFWVIYWELDYFCVLKKL